MLCRSTTILLCALLGATAACAQAPQPYPSKFLRIVTAATGSANDWGSRVLAQELTAALGQQVIVENRGGLSMEQVARAPADGYTLLGYGSAAWLTQFLRDGVTWDAGRDFTAVSLAMSSPNILVVHPSLPVKSTRELIALAKARPGELNYAAGTIGAAPHLASELFNAMAGTRIVRIAYKGTGPSVIALLGGEVHLMIAGLGSVAPHTKSGKLRALAITSAKPSALAPELPTSASVLPGYESTSVLGMFVPAKTPTAIINRLQLEITRAVNKPEVKELLFNAGVDAIGSTPEELAAYVKNDTLRMGKVIRDASIRE
jgi:tripartite-type tricarboxylate transporter receptor subunit TctC